MTAQPTRHECAISNRSLPAQAPRSYVVLHRARVRADYARSSARTVAALSSSPMSVKTCRAPWSLARASGAVSPPRQTARRPGASCWRVSSASVAIVSARVAASIASGYWRKQIENAQAR